MIASLIEMYPAAQCSYSKQNVKEPMMVSRILYRFDRPQDGHRASPRPARRSPTNGWFASKQYLYQQMFFKTRFSLKFISGQAASRWCSTPLMFQQYSSISVGSNGALCSQALEQSMKWWAKHPAVKQRGTRSLLCLMEGNQHHCEDVKMFKGWCDSSHDLSLSFDYFVGFKYFMGCLSLAQPCSLVKTIATLPKSSSYLVTVRT